MHLEKPSLARHLEYPTLKGYAVFQKSSFADVRRVRRPAERSSSSLQSAKRTSIRHRGPDVAAAQMAVFREWEQAKEKGFADLKLVTQPTLVVNGVHDEMIPVANSYRLSENLPNAMLLVYPDSGHGSLFQFHESFTRQAAAFLTSNSPLAPY